MINLDLAFVFQMVNFLVLVLVLNVFLYKPIRKILADRDTEVSGAKARAAEVDRDVQGKMAQYEARLREVKAQAAEEKNARKKEALAEEATIIEKARVEASDSLATIKNKVAKEAADAKELLREQARSLSMEICEKVLGRSL
ncbi:MAG: F-type H+-transporting ATPase subunit [Geobacteraceae bacterium]|nr:MAG: F-type H+-transporting ATPase subunit [Geobacteraceae bacterium]